MPRDVRAPPTCVRLALAVVQPGFDGPDRARVAAATGSAGAWAGWRCSPATSVARAGRRPHVGGSTRPTPRRWSAMDEEGGDVTRVQHATGSSWPGNLALGVVDDTALTRRVARPRSAPMLDDLGIDLDYAPDADVNVEAANPVIGVRSFGADADLVARHTAAWVSGLQSAGRAGLREALPGPRRHRRRQPPRAPRGGRSATRRPARGSCRSGPPSRPARPRS